MATTVSLLKVTSDMKVIFHSPSSYNENPTDEVFYLLTYFIVGELSNLSGYKLVKEFTTTEINSTVEVFNYPEIVDNKNGENYFTEILVTAHHHNSIYGNLWAGAIKLAGVPVNQKVASTIYKKQNINIIEFDNSDETLWRNHLLANIKGKNITFKVFVLKITL